MITATYEGRRVEAPVSVRISTRSTSSVRVLYAIPSDREFRADASEAIANAIVDLQSWYRRELGGLTFSIYEATPEVCRMNEPEAYYESGNAWARIVEGVQPCALVQHDHPDFVWVIYPDVEESCEEYFEFGDAGHELGAGGAGLTILPDIEGITNPGKDFYWCGEKSYFDPIGRWIGGLGHELGHALGLPHPPGCDPWDPMTCDDLEALSLMHDGYAPYPDAYLLPDDKEIPDPFAVHRKRACAYAQFARCLKRIERSGRSAGAGRRARGKCPGLAGSRNLLGLGRDRQGRGLRDSSARRLIRPIYPEHPCRRRWGLRMAGLPRPWRDHDGARAGDTS